MPWTRITRKFGWGSSPHPSTPENRNGCCSDVTPAVVSPRSSSKKASLDELEEVIVPDDAHNSALPQTQKYCWGRASSGPHNNNRNGWASVSSSSDVVDSSESPSVSEKVKTSESVPLVCENDTTFTRTDIHDCGVSTKTNRNGWGSDASPAVVILIVSSTNNSHKTSAATIPENFLPSTSQTKKNG